MSRIIIASGPVIVENGKVLLNQHGEVEFWKFCGGQVRDFSLTLEENAMLKVKEEMGLEIEILDRNPFITFATKESSEGEIDVILVHFLAKRIGEISPGPEIKKWGWLPPRKHRARKSRSQYFTRPQTLPVFTIKSFTTFKIFSSFNPASNKISLRLP